MPLVTDIDKAQVFVLVDVANTVKRAAESPGPTKSFCNKYKYPTGYMHVAIGKVYAVLKHYGLSKNLLTCLMLSAQENSDRRRAKYPGYKAGRVHKTYAPVEVVTWAGKCCDRVPDPVRDFMEVMAYFPCINLEMGDIWETDDAIASAVTQLKKRNKSAVFVILSNDRDLWALMGPRVLCISKPKEEFSLDHLEKDYLTRNPKLLPLAKALFGDNSDKIKKAVARVTKDNFVPGFLDKVRKRKGENVAVAFERTLQKNKKLIRGTSLEKCLGRTKEIKAVLSIIRLRTKLKLKMAANKPDLKKMQEMLGWYELKSVCAGTNAMFAEYKKP